ncbi:MAG: universal stress protein [Euryarchaeota archaeon]|nr:universal stress protein [Euryarchaeota archaeon]
MGGPYSHILVATDGSRFSEAAVCYAMHLAKQSGARLTIIHVANVHGYVEVLWHDMKRKYREEGMRVLEEVREHCSLEGIEAETLLEEGVPYLKIVEAAKRLNCDLIILGSHGHSGLEKMLLGSVAERVIGISPVPVMVVPPEYVVRRGGESGGGKR